MVKFFRLLIQGPENFLCEITCLDKTIKDIKERKKERNGWKGCPTDIVADMEEIVRNLTLPESTTARSLGKIIPPAIYGAYADQDKKPSHIFCLDMKGFRRQSTYTDTIMFSMPTLCINAIIWYY